PGPQLERAALRGNLIHALFQKLPALPSAERRGAALRWLSSRAGDMDAGALADEILAVMDDPAHAALFAETALTEAPISAVVDERVIAGTMDVLLVERGFVRVIDYKTDRRVPSELADIPGRHRRQMAAYVSALEKIFPGRTIEAGLLYTAGPKLIWL
ncbi:MAG: PD-(D/E)XK nuclease family protein, partial [Pacificimonas sp.]